MIVALSPIFLAPNVNVLVANMELRVRTDSVALNQSRYVEGSRKPMLLKIFGKDLALKTYKMEKLVFHF